MAKINYNSHIDLIWLGEKGTQPLWDLGDVIIAGPSTSAIHQLIQERLPATTAQAWLFWDGALGVPETEKVSKAFDTPGDVWHAGLRLGVSGLPRLIDLVNPTWMLNRDPPAEIEATSWRISLRCCLVRTSVLRQLGGVHQDFNTLDGAALEMGHRYVRQGVITRHIPWMAPENLAAVAPEIPLEDELRFIYYRFGRFWASWALLRGWLINDCSLDQAIDAWKSVSHGPGSSISSLFAHDFCRADSNLTDAKVSVLIPTVDRYPYLRTLLSQLECQTVKPYEVILVDQTQPKYRDSNIAYDFPKLPLKIIYLDQAGQCSSRNAGLQAVNGEFILLLDDDIEVQPDFIEIHLLNIRASGADVSSGVAQDVGAGPLPQDFTYMRVSDVFPAGNTLLRLQVLENSGLFDLAYNREARADADLGMRIYLNGAFMLLNPQISVIHHHAPRGGLRTHKARVITYASSRESLTQRHLPSRSEIYLAKRYFTPRQVRENLWLRALGTFSLRGTKWRKAMKFMISAIFFPHTWWKIRARERQADKMLESYPQISSFRSLAMVDSEVQER